jgi:hypothetical protein
MAYRRNEEEKEKYGVKKASKLVFRRNDQLMKIMKVMAKLAEIMKMRNGNGEICNIVIISVSKEKLAKIMKYHNNGV